ncbi:HAD-IC family P-type ATPase [Candidatus Saccharibacteria bacterium]|nr:HAD-IC family P-type ATPase [Candidatus Saccharibacteria bacterium]
MEAFSKYEGLSKDEVAERLKAGQSNAPMEAPFKSGWQIIRDNTFTYFNGVFLIIALILIAVQSYRDLTFLPVIIANTLIGIIQEFRAKAVLEKLTVVNAQEITVIRDGRRQVISVDDIVLDDIVIFKSGDQIAVDAEVLEGHVSVNEALITGEADEIQKGKGAGLLSGAFIVSGECAAKATKVGEDAYAAQLTLRAKAIKTEEQSEIIRSLNKLVRVAGIAIIPIGILLFSQQFFLSGATAQAAAQGMVAAVIGMIPEGLFLLASVALAISAMKMAYQKVLVHEMKSVETLAHVDVFCVDKTGTITSPEMVVDEIVELVRDDYKGVMATFAHSLHADNATMIALQEYFNKKDKGKVEEIVGFSSKYKYSGAVIDGAAYVLGAPEFVLKDDYGKD